MRGTMHRNLSKFFFFHLLLSVLHILDFFVRARWIDLTPELHYNRGFGGVGSFIKMDNSKEKEKEETVPDIIAKQKSAVVTFGPTGSFGYTAVSPLSACTTLGWWSNWPSEEIPSPESTDAAQVQKQLEQRHGTWKDPIIQKCISASNTSSVYPLWTTPKLPHWGKGGCVLLGDAAHTLQATSGQVSFRQSKKGC